MPGGIQFLLAAWLCSHCAAGELGNLLGMSWAGEGRTDKVAHSITIQLNGHLERIETLFSFSIILLLSLLLLLTFLSACPQENYGLYILE